MERRVLKSERKLDIKLDSRFAVVVLKNGSMIGFTTFGKAEQYAKAQVRRGMWTEYGSVYITVSAVPIAYINRDSRDRVWTDMTDSSPALIRGLGI